MGFILSFIFWLFVAVGICLLGIIVVAFILTIIKCALFILVYPIVWLTRNDEPSSTTSHKCDDWL